MMMEMMTGADTMTDMMTGPEMMTDMQTGADRFLSLATRMSVASREGRVIRKKSGSLISTFLGSRKSTFSRN